MELVVPYAFRFSRGSMVKLVLILHLVNDGNLVGNFVLSVGSKKMLVKIAVSLAYYGLVILHVSYDFVRIFLFHLVIFRLVAILS